MFLSDEDTAKAAADAEAMWTRLVADAPVMTPAQATAALKRTKLCGTMDVLDALANRRKRS